MQCIDKRVFASAVCSAFGQISEPCTVILLHWRVQVTLQLTPSVAGDAGSCSVRLGSLAGVPPLLLFNAHAMRELQRCSASQMQSPRANGTSGEQDRREAPEECKVDHGDVWDEEFLQVLEWIGAPGRVAGFG